MSNLQERVKAFLLDERKLKALVNDKDFIIKISDKKATSQDIKDQFKKLGLNLTDEESKEIIKKTNNILKTPAAELTESILGTVAGGVSGSNVALGIGIGSGAGALACTVAGIVLKATGDKVIKGVSVSNSLFYAAAGLTGVSAIGFGTAGYLSRSRAKSSSDDYTPIDFKKLDAQNYLAVHGPDPSTPPPSYNDIYNEEVRNDPFVNFYFGNHNK